MYTFKENFNLYDAEKQPYSFCGEHYTRYTHHFGYTTDDGKYYVNCSGGKHFFRTPAIKDFTLKFNVYYKPPTLVHRYADGTVSFAIYFGYDREERHGRRVFYRYNDDEKSLAVILQDDTRDVITNIKEVKYEDFVWSANEELPFEFSVINGACEYSFNGVGGELEVDSSCGIVGINKEGGIGGFVISSVEISSPDDVKSTTLLSKRFTVPVIDGGTYPYEIDFEIKRYEDGLCELVCRLMGGVGATPAPSVAVSNWVAKNDSFKNPYVRLIGKCPDKKCFLHNGWITFSERVSSTAKTQKILLEAEYGPNEDDPYVSRYYTYDYSSMKYFVFGYEHFKTHSTAMEGDRSEFVFTPDGELIYYGRPLEDDLIFTMKSPYKKELVDRALAGEFHNDEAVLTHLKKNHYFTINDEIKFVATVDSKYDKRFLTTKYFLTNAFFDNTEELFPSKLERTESIVGADVQKAVLEVSGLPQGVYHIAVECYYGEELKARRYFAFEVIDPSSEISPQESSRLPSIHIGDGEMSGPSPWSIKPSLNTNHYIDTVLCGPIWAEEKDVFAVLKALKRKIAIWGDGRTVGKLNLFDFEKTVKNCDYLEFSAPVSGGASGTPYLSWAGVYSSEPVHSAYKEFARLHPEYSIKPLDSEITLEHVKTLEPCFIEWIHFVNAKVYPKLLEQNAKMKAINPKAKRFLYGPFAIYGSNSLGGDAYSWFKYVEQGKLATVFDGFMQFEDYPFNAGYRTSYSSWAVMTIKLVDPNVKLSPEVYGTFGKGCPDGFVNYPFPPLSVSIVPPYQNVTQINEYLYNAVYYKNGRFTYWNDNRFASFPYFDTAPHEKFYEIMYSLGAYLKNKPNSPIRAMTYLFKPSDKDVRCSFMKRKDSFVAKMLYNVSSAAMYYIHDVACTNGIPNGFATDTALDLSADITDVLVLPSTAGLSSSELEKIRELNMSGVALIATSDVTGLEDLFGVKKLDKTATVSKLYAGEDVEIITAAKAHFNYASVGANVLITTDTPGCDVLFTNGRCALINVSLSEVGAENFTRLPSSGARANISKIIRGVCTRVIKEFSRPVATASENCGINVIKTENGDTLVHLVDYTPYNPSPEKKSVSVFFSEEIKCSSIEYLGNYKAKINPLYENGALRGFETEIRVRESMLFKLIK